MMSYHGTPTQSRLINALASLVAFDSITCEDVRGETWRVTLHDTRPIDYDALKSALRREGFFFVKQDDGAITVTTNYWLLVGGGFSQDME